jgi:hypothetical protein
MVVNFRPRGISQGTYKLARTPTVTKKKKKKKKERKKEILCQDGKAIAIMPTFQKSNA